MGVHCVQDHPCLNIFAELALTAFAKAERMEFCFRTVAIDSAAALPIFANIIYVIETYLEYILE
jgi:hypothetical protein